ncbi:MAG: serine/threonine-protein kinase, partial [Nannocystaceae bacterium]
GLAAAHDQGMVHRDFKPANVMVSADGRVRVLDFGLARRFGEPETEDEPSTAEPFDALDSLNSARNTLSIQLTQTGVVMGTPAYMAPEQFFGGFVDARTDQFSFCVVLYRGLFGTRPFAGDDYNALSRAVARGQIQDIPRSSEVPRAVQLVVRRGLSVSRDDRYPSMRALLADLERGVGRARRRLAGAAITVAVAASLGGAAALGSTTSESQTPCLGFETKLAGIWDEDRRGAMRAAFEATELAYADDARVTVDRSLEEYARSWVTLRTEVCEATQVRGDQSEVLMDLRIGCLDERLGDLRALTTVLTEEVDAQVVESTVLGVGQLPPLRQCTTLERDASELLSPPEASAKAEVEQARELIAATNARMIAGKYEDARPRVTAALEHAQASGFLPVIAEAQAALGHVDDMRGDPKPAREAFEQALYAAAESGHDRVQVDALIGLASVLGRHLTETHAALHHAEHAEAVARAQGIFELHAGTIALTRGTAQMAASHLDEALAQFRLAIELSQDGDGANEHAGLAALNNVPVVLGQQGHYREAAAAFELALEALQPRLGPWHPMAGTTHGNLGVTYLSLGKLELAKEHLARATEIYGKVLRPDHPEMGRIYHNLGVVEGTAGDYEAARRSYQRALELKVRALGPDHVSVATSSNNLADALLHLQRPAEAIVYIEDALRIWNRATPDNPQSLVGLVSLAEAHLALDRPEQALPHLRRAIELGEGGNVEPIKLAEAYFVVARALLRSGGDRDEAIAMAERSRAMYQATDGDATKQVAAIDRWLAAPS